MLDLKYNNVSPDNLFYAGVLIYDYNNVATMKFEYLTFKFKIWNFFSNFLTSNRLTFRASVYDPNFYMPSITTIDFLINLAPE